MLSRVSSRSVRSLSAALAVAALLTALVIPAQAAPQYESQAIGPMVALVSWVQELLGSSVKPQEPAPTPERVNQKTGQCMDPNGKPVPCPDSD